jgi:hypothetical protein
MSRERRVAPAGRACSGLTTEQLIYGGRAVGWGGRAVGWLVVPSLEAG